MIQTERPMFFRTKSGSCTLENGQLKLTREGARGQLSEAIFGRTMMRARIVYGVFAALFLIEGVWALLRGDNAVMGVVFTALGIYVLRVAVLGNRDVTADMEIALDSIRSVKPHAPRPPLRRGYFEVHYEAGGAPRRRFIMLPGVLSGGAAEFEKASEVFRQLGLLK